MLDSNGSNIQILYSIIAILRYIFETNSYLDLSLICQVVQHFEFIIHLNLNWCINIHLQRILNNHSDNIVIIFGIATT